MEATNPGVVQEEPPNFAKTGRFFRVIPVCLL
jgi:hypothetical protein